MNGFSVQLKNVLKIYLNYVTYQLQLKCYIYNTCSKFNDVGFLLFIKSQFTINESYVYWAVHHCDSWRIKDQLDVTCYFISLLMCSTLIYPSISVWLGWSGIRVEGWSPQHGYHSNPTTPKLQHTSNQEQYDQCGNSTEWSQAPDEGYINVRNMLSK